MGIFDNGDDAQLPDKVGSKIGRYARMGLGVAYRWIKKKESPSTRKDEKHNEFSNREEINLRKNTRDKRPTIKEVKKIANSLAKEINSVNADLSKETSLRRTNTQNF